MDVELDGGAMSRKSESRGKAYSWNKRFKQKMQWFTNCVPQTASASPGNLLKCKFLDHIPAVLNQKLGAGFRNLWFFGGGGI
jgi:hypothetical protein